MKEESVIAQAFFNIIIHVPPIREQSAIAMVLQIADVEIIKSEVKLKLLEKQKRSLMQ